ncbi:MAG TPA: DUF1592 domain-containing protein [Methylomirabilota bacterium]|nr:DUF1592 domain-containing protein [Methylomirabilota bacterium]
MTVCRQFVYSILGILLLSFCPSLSAASPLEKGRAIYKSQCLHCHGERGEGVADMYDEALYGDKSVEALAKVIARTMPEDKKRKCSPREAELVAQYIYDAFYSPEARLRFQPPRVELARLTNPQYVNTVADLFASFRHEQKLSPTNGLVGLYYNARNFNNEKKAFERVDAQVRFDFGEGGPSPDTNIISDKEFAIRWRGSIHVDRTGDYQFGVRTQNGVRLWVNNDRTALIDSWVSSGTVVREERATVHLLGGRSYPITVEYFKFKDKTASILLEWRPPHRVWEPIPTTALNPNRFPETIVVSTPFPPDDSSAGYERGVNISADWDQATTLAAVEAVSLLAEQWPQYIGSKLDEPKAQDKARAFLTTFVERAFRQPLSAEDKAQFVEKHLENATDGKSLEDGLKRGVLLALKSPRFLYPGLNNGAPAGYRVATRLSYALWDSMPDAELLSLAAAGRLQEGSLVQEQAARMLKNPRAKTKLHDFFHNWLSLEEAEDLSKDTTAYPDFNDQVVSDLRTSLELFVDEVAWSEASDYRQLLLADYIYVNDRLAPLYGAEVPTAGEFRKATFKAGERSGVITHPYLLAMLAYHKSTSPIHRGVFLTRNIIGRALKPPPMAIEFMDGRFDPAMTVREKVTELTKSDACMNCHSIINPLGFSLENFDAIGRFRTRENNKKVDTTGKYPTLEGKTVRLKNSRDVAEHAAKSPEAHRGFIQQLFHHTVKQPPAAYGAETLESLRQSFASNNYNIQKLLLEIAQRAALHELKPQPSPSHLQQAGAAGAPQPRKES